MSSHSLSAECSFILPPSPSFVKLFFHFFLKSFLLLFSLSFFSPFSSVFFYLSYFFVSNKKTVIPTVFNYFLIPFDTASINKLLILLFTHIYHFKFMRTSLVSHLHIRHPVYDTMTKNKKIPNRVSEELAACYCCADALSSPL